MRLVGATSLHPAAIILEKGGMIDTGSIIPIDYLYTYGACGSDFFSLDRLAYSIQTIDLCFSAGMVAIGVLIGAFGSVLSMRKF